MPTTSTDLKLSELRVPFQQWRRSGTLQKEQNAPATLVVQHSCDKCAKEHGGGGSGGGGTSLAVQS